MVQSIINIKKHPFFLGALLIIGYLSFMDVGGIPTSKFFEFKRSDSIIHFLMYSFLSFVFFIENHYRSTNKANTLSPWAFIFLLISLGAIIEIFQPIISNRSCEFFDFAANVVGVIWGYYFHRMIVWLLKR
jgi:VanZ family protein